MNSFDFVQRFSIICLASLLLSACSIWPSKKADTALDAEDLNAMTSAASATAPGALPATPMSAPQNRISTTPGEPAMVNQKPDFGVITISRHGPGYDITLQLDTGEDNVSFSMDLPDDEEGEAKLGSIAEQLKAMDEGKPADVTTGTPSATKSSATQAQQTGSANDSIVVAQQLFYRRDYLGALQATEQAIERQPDFALAWALKGSLYYKMGRKDEARTAWQKALELDPDMPDVRATLNSLY